MVRPMCPTLPRLLAASILALCSGARAESPLHYQCDTVLTYGPGPCKGSVPAAQDQSSLDIDLDRNTWSSGNAGGAAESSGKVITLRQWGARAGRDATLDRASGAFEYRYQSGCLVQHQAGTCKAQP